MLEKFIQKRFIRMLAFIFFGIAKIVFEGIVSIASVIPFSIIGLFHYPVLEWYFINVEPYVIPVAYVVLFGILLLMYLSDKKQAAPVVHSPVMHNVETNQTPKEEFNTVNFMICIGFIMLALSKKH